MTEKANNVIVIENQIKKEEYIRYVMSKAKKLNNEQIKQIMSHVEKLKIQHTQ